MWLELWLPRSVLSGVTPGPEGCLQHVGHVTSGGSRGFWLRQISSTSCSSLQKETKKGCYNFFKSSQFQSITPQISKSHSTFGSKISHIIIDGQYVLENCNFSKRLGDFALQCTKGPRRTIFCINFKTKSRFFCVSTFEKCPNGKFVTSNCKETCGCDRNFSESTVRNLD